MQKSKDVVGEVTCSILADWGMVFVEPTIKDQIKFADGISGIIARVKFSGPHNGECKVICHEDLAIQLYHNVLGTDASPVCGEQYDSVAELANVLAGNFLTAMYGQKVAFTMTSPSLKVVSGDSVFSECEDFMCWFMSDENIPISVGFKSEK